MSEGREIRWTPYDRVVELVGDAARPVGVAGVAVLEHGAVHMAFDIAEGGALIRAVVDGEVQDDLDQQVFLDLLDDTEVPFLMVLHQGGAWPVPPDDELDGALARLGALAVVDDVLRCDALAPVARLIATCEAAALGLAAAGALGTVWRAAADRLWSVVGDPELDDLRAAATAAERRAVVEQLARCLPTHSAHLDDAVAAVRARWDRPDTRDHPSRGDEVLTVAELLGPLDAAPAPAAAAAPAPRRARVVRAADAGGPTGPVHARVGDEVRVVPPPGTAADAWVRVAIRADRLLMAAAPLTAARDGVVRLPLDAAVPDDALVVDVVDDPSAPVRDARGEALAEAVAAGRRAVASERQGRLDVAAAAWRRCAEAWRRAGDEERAAAAEARAAEPRLGAPLAHERAAV